jgi:hypothetical protein
MLVSSTTDRVGERFTSEIPPTFWDISLTSMLIPSTVERVGAVFAKEIPPSFFKYLLPTG